jgi:hypothetical protein
MTHSTVRPGLALAALTVSALLAACSSSSSTTSTPTSSSSTTAAAAPGGPGTPTSCSVVTKAEAAAALGQPVTGPHIGKATVEGGKACVWYGPSIPASVSPNIPVGDTVRVVLVTGPNAKKFFDDYRSKSPAAKTITGLGDQAFYDGFASLSVLKGDAYLRIFSGAGALGPEETLARDALPRM